MNVEWKPVVGFEGTYEVSSLGEVHRLLDRHGKSGRFPLSLKRRNKQGYVVIELSLNGQKKRMFLHRIVAFAFLGPAPSSVHEVNHKHGKDRNGMDDLEWVTPKQNTDHAKESGLLRPNRGSDNGRAKLTESAVSEIRSLKGILGARVIARRFGVSRSAVQFIHQGKHWTAA